jgi:hypothetical protein
MVLRFEVHGFGGRFAGLSLRKGLDFVTKKSEIVPLHVEREQPHGSLRFFPPFFAEWCSAVRGNLL